MEKSVIERLATEIASGGFGRADGEPDELSFWTFETVDLHEFAIRFAALVAEECAKVCEKTMTTGWAADVSGVDHDSINAKLWGAAESIRAKFAVD